jgi:hypothetical protein
MWSTPHTSTYNDNLHSNLSSDAVSTLFHVLLASLDIATRRNYGSSLLRFTQFCDEQHTPEALRMPTSETLLSAFCASWAGKVAATTVSTWLAGLHFWHKFHGTPWLGGKILNAVTKGVAKMVPNSSKRPQRPPVTIQHMHALFEKLDLSNSFDAAVWALACLAFWCCNR